MALAGSLFVPGIATIWSAWQKFSHPVAPDPVAPSLEGVGALAINLFCVT